MFDCVKSANNDLNSIALCHKQCFKQSLSTQLGMPYIKKSFEWFLSKNNCFLFHITNSDGLVTGYCGGFIPSYIGDGSTSGIMQYTMKQALAGIVRHPWLLFHSEVIGMYPLILKNIRSKILKKKGQKLPAQPVAEFDKRVGLVVIGVHPGYRGSGVFPALMDEFEKRALAYNIDKLVLSVKTTNARAIKAYTKQGWFIAKQHPNTLEMNKFLK